MKYLNLSVAAVAIAILTGCSKGLDGIYEGSMMGSLTFESSHEVYSNVAGVEMLSEYEVDGNKVKIKHANGMTMVMTIQDDGSLVGMGQTYRKVDN